MSQSESSLCNLTLEDSDLRKLEELDPFQTDGYQTIARVPVDLHIVFTGHNGKETSDRQPVSFQILTRWVRPQASRSKEPKGDPVLDAVRVCLSSEEDIFLSMVCNMSTATFQGLKTKNDLNIAFKDFPSVLASMLGNCGGGEGSNIAELRLSHQGGGRLVVVQRTQYKAIQLLDLFFMGNSIEKTQQSIIYRYNFNKSKLSMIDNSIESIYRLLAVKNPPLLAYIQKNVGEEI